MHDYSGQIKNYPGTYTNNDASSQSICSAGYYCSDARSSRSGVGNTYYSGAGQTLRTPIPSFLYITSGTRTEVAVLIAAKGKVINTNQNGVTNCASAYCPGIDGQTYGLYSGLTHTTGSGVLEVKVPGASCNDGEYSNGGIAWHDCSAGASDRSECTTSGGTAIKTQFSESFLNSATEREHATITCLPTSTSSAGTGSSASGYLGQICGDEDSGTAVDQSECDGIRSTSDNSTIVSGRTMQTISTYGYCTWCPDDLNCQFHNSFFTFFRGYLLECDKNEYSPLLDLDCHRKNHDTYCKDGYYRAILTTEKDDIWVHDQDKGTECKAINEAASGTYTAVDSKYTPQCQAGDFLRYGIEGCAANTQGFYNAANQVNPSTTMCTEGYYCHLDRINDELVTTQFSCPKGSYGVTAGARTEAYQCDKWPEGKYCNEGTKSSTTVDWPKGYVWEPGTGHQLEISCPPGFYGLKTGSKYFDDGCGMWPAGKFCKDNPTTDVSTAATDWPAGYFCFRQVEESNKFPVMPGSYIGSTAQSTIAGSTPCTAGKYCPLAATAEVDCPSGTYTTDTGMGEIQNCGPWPTGTYICIKTQNWDKNIYPYSKIYIEFLIVLLLNIQYWRSRFLKVVLHICMHTCKACPTAGSASAPVDCAAGHYWPQGTLSATAYKWPAGTYSANVNNKAVADCTLWPAGSSCIEASSAVQASVVVWCQFCVGMKIVK
jgi:hypothetical protein